MAMGSMMIGVKYNTTLKDPGTTGILRMVRVISASLPPSSHINRASPLSSSKASIGRNENNFTFITPNDPRSAMKLNVDFASIKGHKFNKVDGSKLAPPLLNILKDSDKGGGYMFEFDNVSNRDPCRDFVGKVNGPKIANILFSLMSNVGQKVRNNCIFCLLKYCLLRRPELPRCPSRVAALRAYRRHICSLVVFFIINDRMYLSEKIVVCRILLYLILAYLYQITFIYFMIIYRPKIIKPTGPPRKHWNRTL
ncbi:hypothetical protein ABZP36_008202 [Zizania latifolia]